MKKLFFTMLLCVISISVSAQAHLTFKGVPIDGSLTSFVEKLKAKGFTSVVNNSDGATMKGNFGGKICKIRVGITKTSKKVYLVIVQVEESDSWRTLKSTYNEYKSLLTTKYGKGKSVECFFSPYEEGDGEEMNALRLRKCLYKTTFETSKGYVMLTIAHVEGGDEVMLCYFDKINRALFEREKKTC